MLKLGLRSGLLSALLMLAPAVWAGDDTKTDPTGQTEQPRDPAARKAAKKARQARKQAAKQAKLEAQRPQREARTFRQLELKEGLAERVERLSSELTWHESLAAAQAEARKQDKPILLIQALGDLRGLL